MLPVDILKIDRSFVDNIVAPRQGTAFVRAIVRLADALMMTTVAEGVETRTQAQALLDVGCHLGQGYLFAAPMPRPHLPGALADDEPTATTPGEGRWPVSSALQLN